MWLCPSHVGCPNALPASEDLVLLDTRAPPLDCEPFDWELFPDSPFGGATGCPPGTGGRRTNC